MPNKYGAKKTNFKGIQYDSKGEAALAQNIDILLQAGEVSAVETQSTFTLFGQRGSAICKHRVDFFLTFKDKHQEAWEFKGVATAAWRIKQKLFIDNYPEIKYVVFTKNDL